MSENAFFLITNPTLLSIALAEAHHVSRLWEVDVHVFLEDVDPAETRDVPAIENVFVHVNKLARFLPSKMPQTELLPWVTFLRIAGPKLLSDYRRLIYIDTDVHAIRRSDALWTVPLKHGVGAVLDQGMLLISGFETTGVGKFVAPRGVRGNRYFNAGVLVIDPKQWDADGLLSGLEAYFSRYRQAATLLDQDYLNYALEDRWTEHSPSVNLMTQIYDLGLGQPWPPVFLHVTGAYKPWSPIDGSFDSHLHVRLRDLYARMLDRLELPHPVTRPVEPSMARQIKAAARRALGRIGVVSGKERRNRRDAVTMAGRADEYFRRALREGQFADMPADAPLAPFEMPELAFTGHRLRNNRDDLDLQAI